MSAATIDTILIGERVGFGDMYNGVCTDGLRVPAGGVLDTFYTEEGHKWMGYCLPHGGAIDVSDPRDYPIFITVSFIDDAGRVGSVGEQAVWR